MPFPAIRNYHTHQASEIIQHLNDNLAVYRRAASTSASILQSMQKTPRVLIIDLKGEDGDENFMDTNLQNLIATEVTGGKHKNPTSADNFEHILGFEYNDARVTKWNPRQQPEFELPADIDFWIVTGGPAMASVLHSQHNHPDKPFLQRTLNVLKELKRREVIGLNVCLGMQLWGYLHGGEIGKESAKSEVGRVRLSFSEEGKNHPFFHHLNTQPQLDIVANHSESIITPISQLQGNHELLAHNDHTQNQIIATYPDYLTKDEAMKQQKIVLSIQNHPELFGYQMQNLIIRFNDCLSAQGHIPANISATHNFETYQIFHQLLFLLKDRLS